jgi:hypothetical protein
MRIESKRLSFFNSLWRHGAEKRRAVEPPSP